MISLAVCVRSTIRLVRDVDRGYSSERSAVAAVILFFAFALSFIAVFRLLTLVAL